MNDCNQSGVPMAAIIAGRNLDEVLSSYMIFHEEAKKVATTPGKSEEDIFSDTMMGAVYRIYLLGVEDGLKGGTTK